MRTQTLLSWPARNKLQIATKFNPSVYSVHCIKITIALITFLYLSYNGQHVAQSNNMTAIVEGLIVTGKY